MNEKKVKLSTILSVLSLLGIAGAISREYYQLKNMDIKLKGFNILGINLGRNAGVEVRFLFEVSSKNLVPIVIKKQKYNIYINDNLIGEFKNDKDLYKLEPFKKEYISLTGFIPFRSFATNIMDILNQISQVANNEEAVKKVLSKQKFTLEVILTGRYLIIPINEMKIKIDFFLSEFLNKENK